MRTSKTIFLFAFIWLIVSFPQPSWAKYTSNNSVNHRDDVTKSQQVLSESIHKLHSLSLEQLEVGLKNEAQLLQVEQLIQDNLALSAQVNQKKPTDLEIQIADFRNQMIAIKKSGESTDFSQRLSLLESEANSLQNRIDDFQSESSTSDKDIIAIESELAELSFLLTRLKFDISGLTVPVVISPDEVENFELRQSEFTIEVSKLADEKTSWVWLTLALIILIALWTILKTKFSVASRPDKKEVKTLDDDPSFLFSIKPTLLKKVDTSPKSNTEPLISAGKLKASELEMLNGPYAILRKAYCATGRIGYAQNGVPSAADYSFGTGFLISDRHVVTNRHVHGLYGHYLLNKKDPGGIEFRAEKGKTASDFMPFNGNPPLLLPNLDLAIYTLARPVQKRAPIPVTELFPQDFEGRDILVIGYPDTHQPDKQEVLTAVEEDPVFAVKRVSQGKVLKLNSSRGIIDEDKLSCANNNNALFATPVYVHSAVTLGGNSGSPILDIQTGTLLGVQFFGSKIFTQQESASFSAAVAQLTKVNPIKSVARRLPMMDSPTYAT